VDCALNIEFWVILIWYCSDFVATNGNSIHHHHRTKRLWWRAVRRLRGHWTKFRKSFESAWDGTPNQKLSDMHGQHSKPRLTAKATETKRINLFFYLSCHSLCDIQPSTVWFILWYKWWDLNGSHMLSKYK